MPPPRSTGWWRRSRRCPLREALALELRVPEPGDLGERNVDRHGEVDLPPIHLRHQLHLCGEGTRGLVSLGTFLRFGLDAEGERERGLVDQRCAAIARVGLPFQPQVRRARRRPSRIARRILAIGLPAACR